MDRAERQDKLKKMLEDSEAVRGKLLEAIHSNWTDKDDRAALADSFARLAAVEVGIIDRLSATSSPKKPSKTELKTFRP